MSAAIIESDVDRVENFSTDFEIFRRRFDLVVINFLTMR